MPAFPFALVSEIRGRVRLAFARGAGAVPDDDAPPEAPKVPEIELVAFAQDCILSGHLHLSADRLSDLLNDNIEFQFADVMVEDLVGGSPIEIADILVHREELLLVQAGGPRGNTGRRHRTRQHPIVAKVGPYDVRGSIHALPGSDPIASLRRRKPMLALTDAVIEYSVASIPHQRRAGVVIINRDYIDWIAEGQDERVATFEALTDRSGPLVKDFTGDLSS